MADPFNALIVEGTHGIGKSTLIDALVRHHIEQRPRRKIRSFVHLAQSHTYGPLAPSEDAGTLTIEKNVTHLDAIVRHVEWLSASVRTARPHFCFVIIDTLHLTHCVRPGIVSWNDVTGIDTRLKALGCRLLFLKGSAETIRRRSVDACAGSQFLDEYAVKLGRSHDELHAYFVREQDELARLACASKLETLAIANDGDVNSVVNAAYEFWLGNH
jgi:hypothetical protein